MSTDSTHIIPQATLPDSTSHTSPSHIPSSTSLLSHTSLSRTFEELDSSASDPSTGQKINSKARYSNRLKKYSPQIEHILELFKQVKVNTPLLNAIQQVSDYAKFLKNLCTKKRSINIPKVFLATNIFSIIFHSIPIKTKILKGLLFPTLYEVQ